MKTVLLLLGLLPMVFGRPQQDLKELAIKDSIAHFGPAMEDKGEQLGLRDYDPEITDRMVPYANIKYDNAGLGDYSYSFKSFGLSRSEVGELKNEKSLTVTGKYEELLVSKDGFVIIREVGYVADENGYRPFLIKISFL